MSSRISAQGVCFCQICHSHSMLENIFQMNHKKRFFIWALKINIKWRQCKLKTALYWILVRWLWKRNIFKCSLDTFLILRIGNVKPITSKKILDCICNHIMFKYNIKNSKINIKTIIRGNFLSETIIRD